MLNKLKSILGVGGETPTPPKSTTVESTTKSSKNRKPRVKKEKDGALSPKDSATAAGEPYVAILRVEIDPENINAGSFELDWNDKFVVNLIKSGYKQREDDTDQTIVDRWFQTVCRNIALELYEQVEADPKNREDLRRVNRRDLGGGRSEVS
jgi:hypothetical protein